MKKTGKNIAFSFANQIVTIILAFIARTVFVHRLGVDYLGLSGVFNSVLRVISLADLGLQTAMIYSFYKPLAEDDHEKLAALTQYYRRIYLVIASAAAVVPSYIEALETSMPVSSAIID
jgi:O-antigen/teichoic acid export membrane protein